MRSQSFIIISSEAQNRGTEHRPGRPRRFARNSALLFICAVLFSGVAEAQRVAAIAPDTNTLSTDFAEKLLDAFPAPLRTVEISIASAAFASVPVENPYNLSTEEARRIGNVIGCDYFLLIATRTQRRSSSSKPVFFEAYAAIFLANSRTGRLVSWTLNRTEGDTPESADETLMNSIPKVAGELAGMIRSSREAELTSQEFSPFEEVPDENSPKSKGLRPPLPFRRLKPEYTITAYLYDVRATVDVLVDISAEGEIVHTEITRWAGYGLDESVIETVKKMNWRAATRNGRKLPMRVLLRYNFTKIEKTEN